jgi:hypothetical protein
MFRHVDLRIIMSDLLAAFFARREMLSDFEFIVKLQKICLVIVY